MATTRRPQLRSIKTDLNEESSVASWTGNSSKLTPKSGSLSSKKKQQAQQVSERRGISPPSGSPLFANGLPSSSTSKRSSHGNHEALAKEQGQTALSKSISMLHEEADQQLELELETQMTLEHFMGQMVSLKNAFAMLSDVVMHEVDAARSEARRRIESSETRVIAAQDTLERVIGQSGALSERIQKLEENQETILAELLALKSQGERHSSGLAGVTQQLSQVKDQLSEVHNRQVSASAETVKECSELKRHWDSQSQSIVSRINECGAEVSKQRQELAVTSEQRMDDLELLEKALSTLQAQQVRLRSNVDEAIIPLQTDCKSLRSKTDQLDASVSALKMDVVETRHDIEGVERDTRQRFDNVSRVMKAFAEGMNLQPPNFVNLGGD